jgi:hypothetical protein
MLKSVNIVFLNRFLFNRLGLAASLYLTEGRIQMPYTTTLICKLSAINVQNMIQNAVMLSAVATLNSYAKPGSTLKKCLVKRGGLR